MNLQSVASQTKLLQPSWLQQQNQKNLEGDKQLSLNLIVTPSQIPQLRDYQLQVIDDLYQLIKHNQRRILIVAPTGAGKTIIAASFIYQEYSSGKTILFIVHRDVLIKQTLNKFANFGIECGVIAGGYKENKNASVQIASAQTLARRKTNWFTPNIVLIDEAHQTAWNKVVQRQLENYESSNTTFIGLTATPWRLSKREAMSDLFDTLIAAPTPGELILKGYLAPPIYYSVDGADLKGVRTVAGDFNNSDLGVRCNVPEVVNAIVSEWKRLANGRLTIAFAVNVAHAKAIATAFNQAGIAAASVDGTMPTKQREIIYSQLQSGLIKVLASCEALGEGFDVPAISCVLLCRPTKSKAKGWQQIGRGLRIYPGKYDCLILDQAGLIKQFGFIEDITTFTLGQSKHSLPNEAPKKICPQCSAVNRNFDKVCGCCGYQFPVVNKSLDTTDTTFKLLRCTADKVKQYRHYHELLTEAYHRGLKPNWADKQYQIHYGYWPPYKWMHGAIFGSQPTVADKVAYQKYLLRLMKADGQCIGWVEHHMAMIFGVQTSVPLRDNYV
ncbi:DEAD/DEAH box helicase [Okeania sp. SIO2B3]|uniref:DEAD/DEAH box helicase n=1 Tax=Okeania sp. SIO2B3 TaxID=2607784 RepID=UPI0013C241D7|nr:DEAD/DEAH box helicase [Okeania sp. SIO2B3]NET47085.1 DEAD/DEAH box helicase [Okeania sp. SIO2B3]